MLADARDFGFPNDPLVLYLFNPLPERALSEVLQRLEKSLARVPRPVWIVYRNPLLETTLGASAFLEKRAEHRNIRCTGRRGALTHPRFGHKFKLDQRITVI